MDTTANFDLPSGSWIRQFTSRRQVWQVTLLFAGLMAIQALGFLMLGTGRAGLSLSECMLVLEGIVAFACGCAAFRRAQGITALFWFLFSADLLILFLPTGIQAYDTLFNQTLLSDSTRGLLYTLYGAPVLMMLFLPGSHQRTRVKSEIFLDLFQVAIVVGFIYSTYFFVPVQRMLPADALPRDITFSDAQSFLLLIAALVRLQFAGIGSSRNLLIRLTIFLFVCAVATFIGDWIFLRNDPVLIAWSDIGWAVPVAVGGLISITWKPAIESKSAPEPANFVSFLGTNLVLVAMLSGMALLMDRWKEANGIILTVGAIAASLLAFTLRLALTQFHQQQEIAERKAAQTQLTASHQRVGRLLDDARRQTAEITQISLLGSLLQACASREEMFRLIPERLRRLFPGASGGISLLNASRNRIEAVAQWGMCRASQTFSPDECWALRRGCAHTHPGGRSDLRCAHLLGEGPSICIPLIANGEAVGILAIQDDDLISSNFDPDPDSDAFTRRRHLAATVAEHVSVAVANLNLRESLRLQAVRDPLTGLYNRRYMQEFLDRELHSARRKRRPLAVMMIDLDHFKRYNDNFGHSAGDQALAAVGDTLRRCLRAEDVACRYGGEEFALILPECSLQKATVRAEEIRKRLREFRAQSDQQSTDALTVSIGVAAFDETTDHVDLLLKFADDALYQAKREGRDRVVIARPGVLLSEPGSKGSAPVPTLIAKTTQPKLV
jgi:diguanylate cyclase (GGDEF)-like protein